VLELPRAQLVGYAVGAILVVVLGWLTLRGSAGSATAGSTVARSAGSRYATRSAAAAPDGRASGASVSVGAAPAASAVVHVAGAVRHPGVYHLPGGARALDAVKRAGGGAHGANLDGINLAAKVVDGQQIVVPRKVSAAAPATGGGTADDAGGGAEPPAAPVGLNAADATQLQTLDGVGPATAQKIIEWRTAHGGFRSVDDLGQVPGIGPKRLAALRPHVQP
jgi:competence protein ComEA